MSTVLGTCKVGEGERGGRGWLLGGISPTERSSDHWLLAEWPLAACCWDCACSVGSGELWMVRGEGEASEAVEAALFLLAALVFWLTSALDAPVAFGIILLNSLS